MPAGLGTNTTIITAYVHTATTRELHQSEGHRIRRQMVHPPEGPIQEVHLINIKQVSFIFEQEQTSQEQTTPPTRRGEFPVHLRPRSHITSKRGGSIGRLRSGRGADSAGSRRSTQGVFEAAQQATAAIPAYKL